MDRKKEIREMAKTTASHITSDKDMQVDFADMLRMGAEWADQHAHWISIKEELPPKDGRYLFYDEFLGPRVSAYYVECTLVKEITHWMPLPQAPTCLEKPNNCEKGGEDEI